MQLDSKEVSKRVQNFIDARTVNVNRERYLPINDKTVYYLMMELIIPNEEYYDVDDFRSRA